MSFKTIITNYLAPFLASTALSCAANTAAPVYNVIPEPVLLEQKEKELGDAFLDLAWKVQKWGECVEYELNSIDVCMATDRITLGDNGLYVRRVKYYNTDKDEDYEFIDILASHASFPAYTMNEDSIRKIKDLEISCRLDVETKRFLYTKVTEKKTDYDLPQENETTIDILRFNALDQQIPVQDGECVYPSK
ncbi:MAG: hypothetical protein Q8R37_05215 [Nanoarchaeota archaeon]|nr:hypothetical protein [Nanoarchaeota archaeon]